MTCPPFTLRTGVLAGIAALLLAGACATDRAAGRATDRASDRTSLTSGQSRAAGAEQEREEREEPASDWFMAQRLSVDRVLPADVIARAAAQARATRNDGPDAGGTWVPAGPANIGGRLSSLGVGRDMAGNELLWAGSAAGGVFTSSDGGATWQPRFDGQTALSIGSIAVHPTIPQTVYVGTGEEDPTSASYDGQGLFRTQDAGATWSPAGLAETRRIARLAIDPSNPSRIFAAASGGLYNLDVHRGLYRTLDGGATWTKVLYIDVDAGAVDVVIDPATPTRVYAAIWQRSRANNTTSWGGTKSAIYRSLDGGTTWTKLGGGLPTGSLGRIGLAVAPSAPATVYAAIHETSGSFKGVYRSTNSGDTWTKVDTSPPLSAALSTYGWFFGPIRVHPTNPQIVYVLDVNLWRSTNGGTSWSSFGGTMHVDHHDLIVESSGRMLFANDGGFYKSPNLGTTITRFTSFPISQFYDICTDEKRPQRRIGGLQDNSTVRTKTGSTSDWDTILGGDGMECEIDWNDGQRVYAEYQNGAIHRSTDGGDSMQSATSGIDPGERVNWSAPIRIDPVTPSTLYTGAQKVYRSTDYAVSWQAISPDVTINAQGPGSPARSTVSAIAVSPVDPQVIWAGTDNGNVWVTENGGTSWTQVNPAPDTYWVTELAADPFDRRTVYLTVSGYKLASSLPYIRVSRDLGASWQTIVGNLPQVPLNSVLPDPLYRDRLFAGSDIGVHVTADGGQTWSLLGTGVPTVVVMDLALNRAQYRLYAGTHARSIFAYDLAQLPQQDWDHDGAGNLDDCARDDGTTYPGAPEANDGRDNQCAGDAGFGLVDELEGLVRFDDSTTLRWTAQPGATHYQVLRSPDRRFASGCTRTTVAGAEATDAAAPPAGTALHYLVRALAPFAGSWGRNSSGAERAPSCP